MAAIASSASPPAFLTVAISSLAVLRSARIALDLGEQTAAPLLHGEELVERRRAAPAALERPADLVGVGAHHLHVEHRDSSRRGGVVAARLHCGYRTAPRSCACAGVHRTRRPCIARLTLRRDRSEPPMRHDAATGHRAAAACGAGRVAARLALASRWRAPGRPRAPSAPRPHPPRARRPIAVQRRSQLHRSSPAARSRSRGVVAPGRRGSGGRRSARRTSTWSRALTDASGAYSFAFTPEAQRRRDGAPGRRRHASARRRRSWCSRRSAVSHGARSRS